MADATGPARFGSGPAFALGVEWELLLVDPAEHRLAPVAVDVIGRAVPGAGAIKPDTYAAEVELVTPVCADAGEAAAALRDLRARAQAAGATLLGAGVHPDAAFGDVEHHPDARYQTIVASMRGLITRTPTAALHVHVGMPDADTALRTFNGLRPHLPLLQALAANSPFWHGTDSGFASARAHAFRAYPRAELPRAFASWEDWAASVAAVCAQGDAPDYTFLWWDVRLHPRVGTVEVRAMDAPARLEDAVALAALVHGLARHAAEAGPPAGVPPREALAEQSFLAARDGLGARLGGASVPELARRAVALARAAGGGGELELVERLVAGGGGAARQRAAFAAGGMRGLLACLVAETYG